MGNNSSARSSTTQLLPPVPRERLPPPRFGDFIAVMSIDGGGMRGLIPAVVLEEKLQDIDREGRREKNENARIADYLDVIVGTSMGGLIAATLERPKFNPEQIKNFYVKNGPNIFPERNRWPGLLRMVRAWWGARYDVEIKEVTGKNTTLADTVTELKLVVPTLDVHRHRLQPVIFSSFKEHLPDPETMMPHRRELLSDAVYIGTTSSNNDLFFFKAKALRIDSRKRWVYHLIDGDGGVAANNATMTAITEVTMEVLLGNPDFHSDVNYNRYLVISIGTGCITMVQRAYTAEDCANWGGFNWLYNMSNNHSPLMDVYSQASAVLADLHGAMLLRNSDQPEEKQNYLRIQAQASLFEDPVMSMDTATEKNMENLVKIGDKLPGEKVDLYMPTCCSRILRRTSIPA